MFMPGDYPRFTTHEKAAMLAAYKELCGCQRCGIMVPSRALDFHHVYGVKSFSAHTLALHSTATMLTELEKCQVLCATCHRCVHGQS
jgi:hypothetical protein